MVQDYQVKFELKKFFDKEFKGIYTTSDLLSSYIVEHNNLKKANLLSAEINAVLNGTKTSGGWDTQGLLLAKITASETKLYDDFEAWAENNNIAPSFVLPTPDFKVIVEAWRDNLLEETK
jgi:hypothetical protein